MAGDLTTIIWGLTDGRENEGDMAAMESDGL
jgi:hypothetical protein